MILFFNKLSKIIQINYPKKVNKLSKLDNNCTLIDKRFNFMYRYI